MRNKLANLAMVLAAIFAVLAVKSQLIELPEVRPASAQGEFSAERAAQRLAFVLGDQRPHPADTAANDAVRERIAAQLRAIGLQPRVRDRMACAEFVKARGVACTRVRNVVATIGPNSGRHLLLSAHYDSSPVGPGAADAGIGVASLLEIAAILRGRALERPITFLFNEGEELGLIGARAFLADPLSREVDSLINLEARGVSGPAHMFETSRPNAPAIAAFADAVERPVANSLSVDVYRLMPNSTDVTMFAERDWTTLNLAIIGNETRYHSPGDDLAALDRRSLQHMGDQALALALRLSHGVPPAAGERIFMDVTGRTLLVLPMTLGLTLLALLLLAFAWLSWRRKSLGRGLATVAASIVAGTALAWGGEMLLSALRPGMFWRAFPLWTHLAVYASAMLGAVAVLATVGARLDRSRLRAAFWLAFLIAGSLVAIIAPGGIVYFLLPPLAALAGMLAGRRWRLAESLGAIAAIVLLYVTWGAMLGLLEELLNSGPMWLFAPLGMILVLPILIEAQPLLRDLPRRSATAVAALFALAGWAAAAAAPAYSADRQQAFTLEHVTDAADGKSHWSILNDFAPLPAAYDGIGRWRFASLAHSKRKRWLAAAPPASAQPAAVEVLSRSRSPEGRRVRIRLRPNGAASVTLVAPEDADIRAAGAGTFVRPVGRHATSGQYFLRCFGRSCDGFEMDVVIGNPKPVEMVVVASRRGLPPSARPLLDAPLRFARPQYSPDSTTVLSRVRL